MNKPIRAALLLGVGALFSFLPPALTHAERAPAAFQTGVVQPFGQARK